MAVSGSSKLKILYLMEILWQKTDDEHILTATELCDELAKRGITCERKSIYTDIDLLTKFGFDIIYTRSPKSGYFLAERTFQLPELRLLMDAVQSANFITPNKTKQLLEKIEGMASISQAKKLASQIYVDNRVKSTNEEIYYNIDVLNKAIQTGHQVEFLYFRRKLTGKLTFSAEEKRFVVNPYALIWSNDHYYLVSNNPKYKNLMHTRVDRMKKVKILDTFSRRFSEVSPYKRHFDSADYAKKLFNMYSGGAEETVELLCRREILEEILDRVGPQVPLRAETELYFTVRFPAVVSDGLASWILQYGGNIRVCAPDSLVDLVRKKAQDVLNVYEKL